MSKYVQITYTAFKKLMDIMKFTEVNIDGTFERVFKFPIKNTELEIRVYSTIGVGESVSRQKGSDAIRCFIYDNKEQRILKLEKRVHRTASALKNTKERCRELYRHVRDHKCPEKDCGGVLLIRENNKTTHLFMGCTNYPTCKHTKNQITPQLKLKLKS